MRKSLVPGPRAELLSVGDCASRPTQEVADASAASFEVFVRAALADAFLRKTRDTTSAWLRSPEMHHDWLDALTFAAGELQIACERLRYRGDDRLRANQRRLEQVQVRLMEARRVRRAYQEENQRAGREWRNMCDAVFTARSWLRGAYGDEADAVRRELCAERGIPGSAPYQEPARNALHGIEIACRSKLIDPLVTADVARLMAAPDHAFRLVVANDAKEQEERSTALRHPLLLRRWEAAVHDLLAELVDRARADSTTVLGDLGDVTGLTGQEVYTLLNSRRFYVALHYRLTELARIVRRLTEDCRARQERLRAPWYAVEVEVRAELARRHPREYAWIRRQMEPFGTPVGSRALDPEWANNSQRRGALKAHVMRCLASGVFEPYTQEERGPAAPAVEPSLFAALMRRKVAAGEISLKGAKTRRERNNRRWRAEQEARARTTEPPPPPRIPAQPRPPSQVQAQVQAQASPPSQAHAQPRPPSQAGAEPQPQPRPPSQVHVQAQAQPSPPSRAAAR
ncbi:hypothetical protein [Streptomyces sp. NPDC059134]|uniref:hypothetical protein n=1 Tax=Streptomyces sp. NPDC059134 TaxID=3346738 RepID=UPI0036CA62C3